jgi:hypothetical protein
VRQFGFDTVLASNYSPARNARLMDRLGELRTVFTRRLSDPPGKDGRVNSSPRVLVIDGASDTETVLKAVLEPRGTTVERSRGHRAAARFERLASPEVVVIDLDAEPEGRRASMPWQRASRVLLGSHQPQGGIADTERFLSKPFQFPELVRLIEELLADRPAA